MTPEQLSVAHLSLQYGLKNDQIRIREGIVLNVGYDSYPCYGYEFFCWRSPECVKEMDAFIKYAKGKKCLLDVGAYHGIFSFVFSKINPDGFAYSFEPFSDPYRVLNNVISLNNDANIETIQAALSDKSGMMKLFEANGHLNEVDIYNEKKEYWVRSITGDAFCFGLFPNIAPDIIKIDCEAGELKVLRGLNNILMKHKPIIFLELHYSQLTEEDLISIMEIIGYLKYIIIDTETDKEIPLSSLLQQKEGEKRIVLK
ncbi:MAG TPA: FkbM family methyltransferase [Agriterribacter sp.]|nr:FkbM family methyltransferase [Agriterribacter sp.]